MNKSQIIKAIEELSTESSSYKIGIGITEHNRPEVFEKSYAEIVRYLPKGAILVVVDDASIRPLKKADFRFNQNVGIAKAKNKCLELLYDAGCDHIFLFDSDTYPISQGWELPYIESKEPHLNYIFKDFAIGRPINDTGEVYRDSKIVAYNHPRGCMLYYHRSVLDKVGGMDTIFGKWGYEHGNLSDRIFMAGMTSFRYMDVIGSEKLIHSADEHRQVNTTVGGAERQKMIQANKGLYEERKFRSYYFPFVEKQNLVISCYFTGVNDPQRNEQWQPDLNSLQPLIKSIKGAKIVMLTNCFESSKQGNLEFVNVESVLSPYIQRWISIRSYLMENAHKYDNVFCVDATDVEMLREPNWNSIGDNLWFGDENEIVGCDWMIKNHQNPILRSFFSENKSNILLNCGVIGASLSNICELLRQVIDFYQYNHLDYGKTEMGIFNYIVYSNWFDKLRTGRWLTTVFKAEEKGNKIATFKHK